MASIKNPHIRPYDFTKTDIAILKNYGSLHPGELQNMKVFWPLYLEAHTKNVHVVNSIFVYENKKILMDGIITPSIKQIVRENLRKQISKKRFLYITLMIISEDGLQAHANGLLYDAKSKNLQRYEPHGVDGPAYVNISCTVVKKIKHAFENIFGVKIKRFEQPVSTCPKIGFQKLQKFGLLFNAKFNRQWKISGYCAAWCVYYMILRANNPTYTSKALQTQAFEDYENTSDYIHQFYYDFLRWKIEFLKHLM
tara:strand:+ start:195 stop:953 length:759 start_codon:yes stop_codon:yes gene_type:complete